MGRLWQYGAPGGLQTFIEVAAFTAFLMLVGHLGEASLAATTLAFTVNNVAWVPMWGLGTAVKAFDGRIEVELIELAGRKIPGEVAAGIALEPGERDDFPALVPKLSEPAVAGIILGTPVYFGNMSSLCKAFLDRCIVFHKDKPLANKVAGVLAVGGARNGGVELTIRSVQVALMSQQMIVVGDALPTGHWGGTVWSGNPAVSAGSTPDISRDDGIASVKNLGRRVAEMSVRLAR